MPKTASSFIQRLLKQNEQILLDNGYFYQPSGFDHCSEITGICEKYGTAKKNINVFVRDQLERAKATGLGNLIISSECLFQRHWEIIKAINEVEASTQVILYWRRQDRFLESAWQQWHFKNLKYENFEQFASQFDQMDNWEKKAQQWNKYTSEELKLSFFDSEQIRNKGIFQDFLEKLDIDKKGDFEFELKANDRWVANKSFNDAGMKLLFDLRNLAEGNIHNHEIQNIVYDIFREIITKPRAVLLDSDSRVRVIQKHHQVNTQVAKEYGVTEEMDVHKVLVQERTPDNLEEMVKKLVSGKFHAK